MSQAGSGGQFAEKHGADATVDPMVAEAIQKVAKAGGLPCAVAFKIAADLGRSPGEIGKTADLLNLRLAKCQMGLFGYTPNKKIVKPAAEIAPPLREAITGALKARRLSCRSAWDIAERFSLPKMAVSAACEAMGVKIVHCQLGAF